MTKVHQLFTQAKTYGPEKLKVLGDAFDGAWQSMKDSFGDDNEAAQRARATLANVILSLPQSEIRDAERLKNAALQVMHFGYRQSAT